MFFQKNSRTPVPQYTPWNKGKLIGPKPPLQPKHVWAIRTRLQIAGKVRDLALFNLAIDSKLRGCDLVSLKMEDIAPNGSYSSAIAHKAEMRCSLMSALGHKQTL